MDQSQVKGLTASSDKGKQVAAPTSLFHREGEYWTVTYGSSLCRLRDSKGVRHLAYLALRPGQRVAATELVAVAGGDATDGDQGCDDRRTNERARLNVTRSIHTTVRRIAAHDPSLGEYFASTIKTGTFCSYTPVTLPSRQAP